MLLKNAFILLLTLVVYSTALANENSTSIPFKKEHFFNQEDGWKSVYNKDGLIIYLKEEVLPEGRFIAYKYENSTSKEMSFTLELIKNNKVVSNNKMTITLKKSTAEIFFDPTDTIQLDENESIDDYTVKIN